MNLQYNQYEHGIPAERSAAPEEVRAFMVKVYNWMALGLALTAIVAWGVASSSGLMQTLIQNRGIFIGLIIAELGLVLALSWAINRISATVAMLMFLAYAAINGLTLSFIFMAYTQESITSTFFIFAATFAGMSAFGYFTKRDLSGVGHFMVMGLWGLIIASFVNVFMRSDMLYWLTTYAGVLIFVGLTAWDTQKIKNFAFNAEEGSQEHSKAAIIGALILYLDFINLFLYLLRIFGRRR